MVKYRGIDETGKKGKVQEHKTNWSKLHKQM